MTLAQDAENMILYGPEAPETVKYIPYFGVVRTIQALVRREPVQDSAKTGTTGPKSSQIQHVVVLMDDPEKGVSFPRKGADCIELKKWVWSEELTKMTVAEILSQRGGLFKLQVVA